MAERTWSVYLSGEIHSDWREQIEAGAREAGLPVTFSGPVTDHAASDDAGTGTLGEEREAFWRDHAGYAAVGKPTITLHDAELDHALKEVDRAAQATARTAEQVVAVLRYVITGALPA